PLSPSITAMAARSCTTRICGVLLMPPAWMRLMYCGRRITPWPSEPCRSASVMSVATRAASAWGRRCVSRADWTKRCSASGGTKVAFMGGGGRVGHAVPAASVGRDAFLLDQLAVALELGLRGAAELGRRGAAWGHTDAQQLVARGGVLERGAHLAVELLH